MYRSFADKIYRYDHNAIFYEAQYAMTILEGYHTGEGPPILCLPTSFYGKPIACCCLVICHLLLSRFQRSEVNS